MWGIFAYWPSWSVSVNKELKPLYISSKTIPLVLCHWRNRGILTVHWKTSFFTFWAHKYSSTSPLLVLYHIPTPFKSFVFAPTSQHGSQCIFSLPLLIFSKFLVREDCAVVAKSLPRGDIRRQFRYLDWRGIISVGIIFWKISLLQHCIPCRQLIWKGRSLYV